MLDKAERCCERLTTIGALLRAAGLGKSRLSDEVIEPEVVAEAVAFLCGPSAWTMTGNVLPLDAGWLAH